MSYVCLLHFILLASAESARILVSQPFGTKSHQNVFVPLITALSDRGHHVTYITNYFTPALADTPNVRQLVLQNGILHAAVNTNQFDVALNDQSAAKSIQTLKVYMFDFPLMIVRSVFEDQQVQTMLVDQHFDLVLVSQAYGSSGYALAWHFQAPFILISPNSMFSGIAAVLGDSEHTEYVPFVLSPYSDQMSLKERLFNTLFTFLFVFANDLQQSSMLNQVRNKLPNCPPLNDIEQNVSMVFSNSHPIFSYPRALPPQVIEIGAIHCRPAKPLPLVKFIQ